MASKLQADRITKIRLRLKNTVVEEIQRCVEAGLSTAAFILLACLLDYLVGYYTNANATQARLADFVDRYFPDEYKEKNRPGLPKMLWTHFRCPLLHNFSLEASPKNPRRREHGMAISQQRDLDGYGNLDIMPHPEYKHGCYILNLEDFFSDVLIASRRFFDETLTDARLRKNLFDRYEERGFLGGIW